VPHEAPAGKTMRPYEPGAVPSLPDTLLEPPLAAASLPLHSHGEGEGGAVGAARRDSHQHLRSLIAALVGATLWGLSGTAAQVLFQAHHIAPQWLVTVRMLGAGLLLYLWLRPPFPRKRVALFLFFALIGLAGVQYTYFAAIAHANAATATLLQSLGLPMIAMYEGVIARKGLTPRRMIAIAAAVLGTALLVLGGQRGSITAQVAPLGLVFGLLSALAAAFYILASVPLVAEFGAWPATTWGFLIGGLAIAFWAPPWAVHPSGSIIAVVLLAGFVVLFGTLAAFGLFLSSLRHIAPTEAGIASTMEPVAAALAAFVFLHVMLAPVQYLGGALILGAVVLLRARAGNSGPPSPARGTGEPEPPEAAFSPSPLRGTSAARGRGERLGRGGGPPAPRAKTGP
jgi:drug/metabolite transporter (DMT)-like permease